MTIQDYVSKDNFKLQIDISVSAEGQNTLDDQETSQE